MQEYLVNVICDTSFLIQIATKRIKNFSNLELEIGSLSFVVPQIVLEELEKLKKDPKKETKVIHTLEFIKKLPIIKISGINADNALINYVKSNQGLIATLDKELKKKIKKFNGTVISLANDRIILE